MADQDGNRSDKYFIYFSDYPVITLGQEEIEKKKVPGRGYLHETTGTYKDTEIALSLDINTVMSNQLVHDAIDEALQYIRGMTEVSFCDNPNVFYKVKDVAIGNITQYADESSELPVKMSCHHAQFLYTGRKEMDIAEAKYNPYSMCCPIYHVTGNGACVLTVNGKTFTVLVADEIYVDTELMIAYKSRSGSYQNTSVTGDYESLWLEHGDNTITASSGFTVKVTPNWRRSL